MNPQQAPTPNEPVGNQSPDPLAPAPSPTPGLPGSNNPMGTPMPAKPNTPQHHLPVGLIIVVVVVVILLAAGVVYLYNVNNKVTAPTTTPSPTTPAAQPVKATDVDQTSQQLDSDIESLNQTNDASTQDLSDTSLGL